jgi:ubiquinone/menaquinone biosynthesis C-methylase UbiE
MIDMKVHRKIFVSLLFLCVVLGFASITNCLSQEEGPDAWEARHNAIQPPEKVMDALGIEPDMVIGEVGAGRGRYAVHMARRVGEKGLVYANDINESKLIYLKSRCERDGISNIVTILGTVTEPKLPEGELDLVYFINTYHHLDDPVGLLRNIMPSLKADGVLVIIEHDPDKCPDAGSHSTRQDILISQAYEAGYTLVRIETFLERDNINIFRPRR